MDAHNLFDYQGCDTKNLPPLSHTNDPQTSFAAADKMIESGALSFQEQEVYNDIRHYIIDGQHKDFTPKEMAHWQTGDKTENYHRIERRQSGLLNKGKIERTGEKRDGCCVWRLK